MEKTMATTIKRISILGPESTGKTTLARQLAEHYQTVWVPEFARQFLEQKGERYRYRYEDLEIIAKGQLKLEQEIEKKANQYLFCDTDFIVLKIWSSYVFGRVSPYILELVEKHRYDYYLLTNNDVKWEPDPLRESSGTAYRKRIFTIYEQELNKLGVSYSIVKGDGAQRFENVLSILETNLK